MKVTISYRKSNSSVYVRVIDGRGVDFKIPTGLYIDPTHFDPAVPGYSKTSDAPQEVKDKFNAQLHDLLLLVGEEYQHGQDKEYVKQVIDGYFHPEHRPVEETPKPLGTSFFDRADQYLQERRLKGSVDNAPLVAVFRRLRRYEAWQRDMEHRKGFTLTVDDFGSNELERFMRYVGEEYNHFVAHPDFFSGFELYRSTMRPSSKNSACSGANRLKAFLNWCLKKGYTENKSFRNVPTQKGVYGIPYYLTLEERDHVLATDLHAFTYISRARDMFIFQCLVGCRLGDLFSLTRANIVNGFLEYIPNKSLKSGNTELVRCPLANKALDILARYEDNAPRLFPVMSRQYYNESIKFILEISGVNRKVPIINPLTRQEEMHSLCEIATSHIARRTFIGNLYKRVKDQELVASLTGHAANSRAFARYRTIDDDMKRELIDKIQ